MAKIGTAHIELKPVINEAALENITSRLADAVALGVERGIAKASGTEQINLTVNTFHTPK